MSAILRRIAPADNPVLADIIRGVFREFGVDRPGTVYTDPTTDALYTLFDIPGAVLWVAEYDGQIRGCCGIYPTDQLPEGCAELVKFYLHRESRGLGIGRQLMEQSIASAREMGYTQLYIESLPEYNHAVRMYERAGFRMLDAPLGNSGHFGCDIWMSMEL